MRTSRVFAAAVVATALFGAGCGKEESPVEGAVEGAKDALDMREHEKLKDAGEGVEEAVDDAVEGVKDEVDGE